MKLWALGALTTGYSVAALFFLKFWQKTRDRLFAGFSVAFFVLAVNQLAFVFVDERSEARTGLYAVRLVAFSILLWSIVDKNRAAS